MMLKRAYSRLRQSENRNLTCSVITVREQIGTILMNLEDSMLLPTNYRAHTVVRLRFLNQQKENDDCCVGYNSLFGHLVVDSLSYGRGCKTVKRITEEYWR